MEESIREYKEEMNPARVFLQQNLESCNSGILLASEVYKIYKKWTEENGYRPLSERVFGKEVRRVFPKSTRVHRGPSNGRYWCYEFVKFSQDEVCGIKTNESQLF
jgi:phage/plasmid-associated DNA primase